MSKLAPQLFQTIEPLTLKTDTSIFKLGDKYINAEGTIALIESLAFSSFLLVRGCDTIETII